MLTLPFNLKKNAVGSAGVAGPVVRPAWSCVSEAGLTERAACQQDPAVGLRSVSGETGQLRFNSEPPAGWGGGGVHRSNTRVFAVRSSYRRVSQGLHLRPRITR